MSLLLALVLSQAVAPVQLRAGTDILRPITTPRLADGGYALSVSVTQSEPVVVVGSDGGSINPYASLTDGGIGLQVTCDNCAATEVAVSNWPAFQPVTGTFWQATQPVSLVSVPTHGVTGTFWQATQPVSGTFWQTTQPVSIATMPTTPVTGSFWQTTQPVSGTFWQATQPISGSVTATVASTTLTGTPTVTLRKVAATALAQAISCASTATATPPSALTNRTSLSIQNMSSVVVYVGHASVTTANGTALAPASGTTPGGSWSDDVGAQPMFCIVASGTADVRVTEN